MTGFSSSQPPLITLTTDFGDQSHYVAQMKGVILGLCRHARLVDISHRVAPQNIAEAAWLVLNTVAAFPEDSCHLIVVDPGVGTERRMVLARIAGHSFIAPDNGLLGPLAHRKQPDWIRQLTQRQYWAAHPTPTFHGRDIMAHVAGHLAAGVPPDRFGPEVEGLAPLAIETALQTVSGGEGRIVYIDTFGNLITNLPGAWANAPSAATEITLPRQGIVCRELVETYGQRASGELIALIGSAGHVEIAEVNGNAAERCQARVGDPVLLHRTSPSRPD